MPDDWQQLIIDDWLAYTRDDRWASLKCGLSVPRQNGKNGALEIRELFGLVGRGEKIVHTAHQVKTAQKHFRRLKHFFGRKVNDPSANYPELNALVEEMRSVNGQEGIYLRNGGSVEIVARSQGSGRGYTVDVIVCDEAQDMSDDDLEALLSASSAGPLGDPQWLFTGTPPGPRVDGSVFTRNREEATSKGAARRKVCWHEWAADPKDDPADPATWEKANPGLTTGRLLFDVVEAEFGTFSEGGFGRERLGIWPREAEHARVIPGDIWRALLDAGPPNGTPPTAIGVDASHDRVLVIAGCWATGEGRHHVELLQLDHAADTLAATTWLTERARPRRIPVVIDAMSPAASMVPVLRANKVRVVQSTAPDMAKACGLFYDDAMTARLTHGITDGEGGATAQSPLDVALAGAKKRAIGAAGGWGWDRKDPAVNISPLVAVTLARFGASTVRRRSDSKPVPVRRKVVVS